jgi:Delta7-sterol 5-desaturase
MFMETSPSNILLCSILLVAFVTTAVYASGLNSPTLSHNSDGFSSFDESSTGVNETPFPGRLWLENMAQESTNSFVYNGHKYSSAYDAILEGNPTANPVKNFNAFVNSFVVPHHMSVQIIQSFGTFWAHHVITYIRNLIAGIIVYYGTGFLFHYHCYIHPRSKVIFSDRKRPSNEIIMDQIKLAQASLFIYCMLPGISEYLIEEGYTKCYYTLSDIGGFTNYLLYTLLYFTLVEIGIYWMHRTLHENKFLYKHIHMPHHAYSRPDTLTPWASIAFHPLDGMLQACPYVLCLPIVPCHYLTHTIMIFFTAIWATYIHDTMDWNIGPIMGSKYHTVHHTHYIYNYGQIFVFCDRIWGTLRVPVGKTGVMEGPKKVKLLPAEKGWFGSGRGKNKSV